MKVRRVRIPEPGELEALLKRARRARQEEAAIMSLGRRLHRREQDINWREEEREARYYYIAKAREKYANARVPEEDPFVTVTRVLL